jgi:predicted cobalt transporter CbtA
MMVGSLLTRGLLVGLIAGLLVFAFATVFGEPQIEQSIAFEAAQAQAKGEAPEPELVSRDIQSTAGLLTGTVVYGTALGGLFALVFAFAQGRIGRIGPRGLSALLALAGFIAIVLVPALKYPANPPAVGDPETIGIRTKLFFLMMLVSITAMVAAVLIARKLMRRQGIWAATLIAGAGFVVLIGVVQYLLPDINEVPDAFPAVLLWRFRMASFGMQIVMWTSLGLIFGWLAERKLKSQFRFVRSRAA